jgi:hypothetical protein
MLKVEGWADGLPLSLCNVTSTASYLLVDENWPRKAHSSEKDAREEVLWKP